MYSRREFIIKSALAGMLLYLPSCRLGKLTNSDCQDESLLKKASDLHSRILTIDSHCDTPLNLIYPEFDMGYKHNPLLHPSKVDFPRMKEGSLDASFFAVFLSQLARTNDGNHAAKEKTLRIYDAIYGMLNKYSDLAEIALEPDDALKLKNKGKRAIYTGIENGYAIGLDLKNIEEFYKLGMRYLTLCHSSNNDICDSSTDKKGLEHNGLSAFGKDVIAELNRLGVMVDVSHISDKSFYDVIELSKTPIIASHSCSRTLCNHPRNLSDEMLLALKQNGGVIQMCVLNAYVKTPPPDAKRDSAYVALRDKYSKVIMTDEMQRQVVKDWQQIDMDFPEVLTNVAVAVDHIDHIVKTIGIDYVGIGTDFDGGGGLKDCFDVAQLGNFTYEFLKRGYSEQDIQKIWSGNFLRVFSKVRDYANG